MERRIDRQEPIVTRKSRDAKLFGDLVALHRQDMEEAGIKVGRSKDFCLVALDETLGHLKITELDRERFIKFGKDRAKEGAGAVTLGMDFGYIRTVLSHAAAVHGLTISTESLDLARLNCLCERLFKPQTCVRVFCFLQRHLQHNHSHQITLPFRSQKCDRHPCCSHTDGWSVTRPR